MQRRIIRRVEERLGRQARNEALMRSVNEQIAELSEGAVGWAPPEQPFDFQCECGAEGCASRVVMTRGAYERVHGQRDRFAVAPGHRRKGSSTSLKKLTATSSLTRKRGTSSSWSSRSAFDLFVHRAEQRSIARDSVGKTLALA